MIVSSTLLKNLQDPARKFFIGVRAFNAELMQSNRSIGHRLAFFARLCFISKEIKFAALLKLDWKFGFPEILESDISPVCP